MICKHFAFILNSKTTMEPEIMNRHWEIMNATVISETISFKDIEVAIYKTLKIKHAPTPNDRLCIAWNLDYIFLISDGRNFCDILHFAVLMFY